MTTSPGTFDDLKQRYNTKRLGEIFLKLAATKLDEAVFKEIVDAAILVHDARKSPIFELNGKTVDLTKVIPMTVKDWKALKKSGVDVVKISGGEIGMDELVILVEYLCKKANPELTEEDLDALPGAWFGRVGEVVNELGDEIDIPF